MFKRVLYKILGTNCYSVKKELDFRVLEKNTFVTRMSTKTHLLLQSYGTETSIG